MSGLRTCSLNARIGKAILRERTSPVASTTVSNNEASTSELRFSALLVANAWVRSAPAYTRHPVASTVAEA